MKQPATFLSKIAAAVILIPWLVLGGTSQAAEECDNETVNPRFLVEDYLAAFEKENQEHLKAFAEATMAQVPQKILDATTMSADRDGETIVSGGDVVSLLGLSIQSGLVQEKDGVLSVTFTPFSWKLLKDSTNWSDQAKYTEGNNPLLRRFAISTSFGGKGESLDRDGDGEAEDAKTGGFDDIISWELKFRLSKSGRDFREKENWNEIQTIISPSLREVGGEEAALLARLYSIVGLECQPRKAIEEKLKSKEAEAILAERETAYERSLKAVNDAAKAARKAIQKQVWSLVIGGTERREEFGRDELYAAIRGTYPLTLGQDLSFNLQRKEVHSLDDAPNPTTWTLGSKWTAAVLQDLFKTSNMTADFAVSWEYFENVPDATHDSIMTVQAGLEIPISEGVKFPVTVIWANHEDLLKDNDAVEGHFGFKFDVSKLLKGPDDSDE